MDLDPKPSIPLVDGFPQLKQLPAEIQQEVKKAGPIVSAIFSRPSAWLAAGATLLVAFMSGCLAFKVIPAEQLHPFETALTLIVGAWITIVKDVFKGDNQ
jgi:hypothetical protein